MASPIDSIGYGPLPALPQFVSNTNLDTTPVKITIPTPTTSSPVGLKIKIVNGHATQSIAWTLVKRGASAPSITAAFATTSGSIILAGNTETIPLYWGPEATLPYFDLYLVASGASTPYNVTFFFVN